MPHYLLRASYTPETFAALAKDPQDRRAAVAEMAQSLGARLESFYFAFGEDDVVAIVESPDNASAAAAAITVMAGGGVSSISTTVLLTPEEMTNALLKAGAATYRPPQ